MDNGEFINNSDLFEAGQRTAKERVRRAKIELNGIEYTLQYLNINQRYSEQTDFYKRNIPARRIMTTEYTGDLADIKKIEMTSAVLYEYAQGKQLATVFLAGITVEAENGRITSKIFFEIMDADKEDVAIEVIPAGTFLCRQLDLMADVSLPHAIRSAYGDVENTRIVVSNMLLDKYQIGTKKSELQKRI